MMISMLIGSEKKKTNSCPRGEYLDQKEEQIKWKKDMKREWKDAHWPGYAKIMDTMRYNKGE